MNVNQRPVTILIAALGGEGGGVLTEWLMAAAVRAGYPAQSTSIPGVAQRTGATTYYVEIHPTPIAALDGRRPVLGLVPVPGCVDLVVASELLEAVRTVQAGMTSPSARSSSPRPHARSRPPRRFRWATAGSTRPACKTLRAGTAATSWRSTCRR